MPQQKEMELVFKEPLPVPPRPRPIKSPMPLQGPHESNKEFEPRLSAWLQNQPTV